MANNTLNTRILLCSDTTANWAKSTKVLLKGEIGIEFCESDETKIKVGNGTDTWGNLEYFSMTPTEINALISSLNSSAHTHSNKAVLDGTTASFTTALKTKLDGITASADSVAFARALESGTKIGTITINGTGIDIYAPSSYTHPNSGVTAGTYKSVTVDAKGHVTAGSNPTTLAGYGITDAASSNDLATETSRATGVEDGLKTSKANIASPTFTGTPKAPTAAAGTNTTQLATTAFVQTAISNGIAASDAMVIKGTIGSNGTVTALPTTYKTGWTYRVITAGTYAGQVCEIGDLVIALVDRSGSNNADTDWCVAQTNINGAITGIKSGDAYITVSQTGSTVTITHKNVARSDTTSTSNPAYGATFTAVKSVTSDAKGHITGVDVETVKIPAAPTSVSGNAGSATKLATARTIALSGGATGTATSFNGTANISIPVTSLNAMNLTVASADTLILNGGGAN